MNRIVLKINGMDHALRRSLEVTLVLMFVTLPLGSPTLNTIFVVAGCMLSALIFKSRLIREYSVHQWLLPGLFFFLTLSLVWSSDISWGLTLLGRRMSFLAIPLFLYLPLRSVSLRGKIVKAWIVVIAFLCLVCIVYAGIRIFQNGSTYFINQNGDRQFYLYYISLSEPVGLHPTYFSLYVSITIFFLSDLLFSWNKFGKRAVLLTLAILFCVCFLFMLGSRGGIIAFLGASASAILLLRIRMRAKVLIFTLGVAIISLLLYSFPYTKTRMNTAIQKVLDGYSEKEIHSANIHLMNWDVALDVVKKNIILGAGIGGYKKMLKEAYSERGSSDYYNAHSAYLEIMLMTGLVGLSFFALLLFLLTKKIIKINWIPGIAFMFLLMISFLFESVLNVQKGIVLFSLFSIFFLTADKKTPTNTVT